MPDRTANAFWRRAVLTSPAALPGRGHRRGGNGIEQLLMRTRRPHAPLAKVEGKFGEISFPHDQMTHEQLLELIAAIKKSD